MAAGHLPRPGTKYGPCADVQCGHTDCAATRTQAASLCVICKQPIGYETDFYDTRTPEQRNALANEGLSHAVCLEDQVDDERAAQRRAAAEIRDGWDAHVARGGD